MRYSALCMAALLVACGSRTSDGPAGNAGRADAPAPWFVENAHGRGLRFEHESGAAGELLMPEIMCGGAALFDGDGDGDLDAYLVQAGSVRGPSSDRAPNQLYANDGSGQFTDVTEGSGADDRGYGNGVTTGDLNGDGHVDLYVTNLGPNRLLVGSGDLRFEQRLESGSEDAGWGTSALAFDADRDGDLDLYVANYLIWSPDNELPCVDVQGAPDYCSPASYESPAPDALLLNDGSGSFRDVTREAGVAAVGTGLGVGALDADEDGDLDLFVANDGMPDRMWWNQGVDAGLPRFTDLAADLGLAVDGDGVAKAGMGVAIADLDGDGLEDLLVGNLARESDSIFLNRRGRFADSTRRLGMGAVSRPFTRFGLGFHDFDLDGRLDLYQTNGRVQLGDLTADDPYAEPDLLLRGLESGGFEAVSPRAGVANSLVATGRAAAFGDVDADGRVDVLVVNRDAAAHLLIGQDSGATGTWVGFDLRDAKGAPALHARVELETSNGERSARARSGYSYQSASDPRVHFGLAEGERVESATVRWTDGVEQRIEFAVGRYTRVDRD
ncbi:MAG: CRTAC1 family protein [Planctomycetota bacterium]